MVTVSGHRPLMIAVLYVPDPEHPGTVRVEKITATLDGLDCDPHGWSLRLSNPSRVVIDRLARDEGHEFRADAIFPTPRSMVRRTPVVDEPAITRTPVV